MLRALAACAFVSLSATCVLSLCTEYFQTRSKRGRPTPIQVGRSWWGKNRHLPLSGFTHFHIARTFSAEITTSVMLQTLIREFFYLDGLWKMRCIIFVCHSMGGIAVRRFIVVNQVKFIENQTDLGLFLIASPSLSSKDANHLAVLARFIGNTQAAALRFSQTNTWLNDLDREFMTLKESKRISLKGKELIEDEAIRLKKFFGLFSQVVEPFAAGRYFGEAYKVPKSNHNSIAKPSDATAIQHRLLVLFIADMLETKTIVPKSPPKDKNEKTTPEDSKLELVDLRIEEGLFPSQMLDIKLRNIGSRVAYLSRAILLVEKIWKISPVSSLVAAVRRSEVYDVRFPRANTPYSLTVCLSQAIPADNVDRFALRLLMETGRYDYDEYAVMFRVKLEYDGDAKALETGEILYWQDGGLGNSYLEIDRYPDEGTEKYFGLASWAG